jgi:hypothetical protein
MKLACALLSTALAVAVAAPASALTGDFDFTSGGTLSGATGSFVGTNGQTVTVTAIVTDTTTPTLELDRTSDGLGVNANRPTFLGQSFDNRQIDNDGPDEAIVFDFGVASSFAGSTLRLAGIADQFLLFATNTDFTGGVLFGLLDDEELLANGNGCLGGNAGGCTVSVSFTSTSFFRYLVATVPVSGGLESSYRVETITGVSPVPGPAALPLLASAMAGFAVLRRRQTRGSAAA